MEDLKTKRNKIISEVKYVNNKPIFRYVEFSLGNFCNRSCDFCPTAYIKNEKRLIDPRLFDKAVKELVEISFDGLIIFSGFSEPFLNKSIYDYITLIKEKLPKATLLINSNGDLLDKKTIKHIFNLGLDYLSISIYDEFRYSYFFKLKEELNLDNFINLKNRYSNFNKNNRAGYLETKEYLPQPGGCFYPFYLMFINWNGNLLFCCHNFLEYNSIGNLEDVNLIDAWYSDKMYRMRKILMDGRNYIPCNLCDVKGKAEGYKYFKEWKRLINAGKY